MKEHRQIEMEQAVVDYLDGLRKGQGLTIEQWGRRVYPQLTSKAAGMRIQNMRKPMSNTAKRKRLSYADFILMAASLGVSASEVVTLISHKYPDIKDGLE